MTLAYEIAARTIAQQTARTQERAAQMRARAMHRREQQGDQPVYVDDPLVCPACRAEFITGLNCPDCHVQLTDRAFLGAMGSNAGHVLSDAKMAVDTADGLDPERLARKWRAVSVGVWLGGWASLALMGLGLVAGVRAETILVSWMYYVPAALLAAMALRWGRLVRWQQAYGGVGRRMAKRARAGYVAAALTMASSLFFLITVFFILFVS
jgi:hypothetical protein